MGRPSPPLMMPKTRTLWALKVSICSLIFFFPPRAGGSAGHPLLLEKSKKLSSSRNYLFFFFPFIFQHLPLHFTYYKSACTIKHIPCLLTPQSHNHKRVTLGHIPTPISEATFSWLESTYEKKGKKKKKPLHFAYIFSGSTCQKG